MALFLNPPNPARPLAQAFHLPQTQTLPPNLRRHRTTTLKILAPSTQPATPHDAPTQTPGVQGYSSIAALSCTAHPRRGPWPAAFLAPFYAQVRCAYRAGFELIRNLTYVACSARLARELSVGLELRVTTGHSGGGASAFFPHPPSLPLPSSYTPANTGTTCAKMLPDERYGVGCI
ncbi:hypothetical protein B0H16DRAFT_1733044 [Mycena metata]|uniref:Uncharacterized protein n=1 Tax=Mycena metata TaxID=1033252 RepID=A0AAD7HZI1_9AGAR|nr:hypothetical protein B0H16DRAFT_1733044 [Mycena metata]